MLEYMYMQAAAACAQAAAAGDDAAALALETGAAQAAAVILARSGAPAASPSQTPRPPPLERVSPWRRCVHKRLIVARAMCPGEHGMPSDGLVELLRSLLDLLHVV